MKRMSRLALVLACVTGSFCFSGCGPAYTSMLYKSGSKTRGIALMLPVVQTTASVLASSAINWDLREEFNTEIARRLSNSGKIYLLNQNVSSYVAEAFNSPISIVESAVSSQVLPAEFVIATEILEQSLPKNESDPIRVSARVRLFDVRKGSVKLVYQEIMEIKQPQATISSDYNRLNWQHKNFDSTPLGLAHNRLIKEIVARVEGYVCANY